MRTLAIMAEFTNPNKRCMAQVVIHSVHCAVPMACASHQTKSILNRKSWHFRAISTQSDSSRISKFQYSTSISQSRN